MARPRGRANAQAPTLSKRGLGEGGPVHPIKIKIPGLQNPWVLRERN